MIHLVAWAWKKDRYRVSNAVFKVTQIIYEKLDGMMSWYCKHIARHIDTWLDKWLLLHQFMLLSSNHTFFIVYLYAFFALPLKYLCVTCTSRVSHKGRNWHTNASEGRWIWLADCLHSLCVQHCIQWHPTDFWNHDPHYCQRIQLHHN